MAEDSTRQDHGTQRLPNDDDDDDDCGDDDDDDDDEHNTIF